MPVLAIPIINWIVTNGSIVELFNTLRDLNVSKGYRIWTF